MCGMCVISPHDSDDLHTRENKTGSISPACELTVFCTIGQLLSLCA